MKNYNLLKVTIIIFVILVITLVSFFLFVKKSLAPQSNSATESQFNGAGQQNLNNDNMQIPSQPKQDNNQKAIIQTIDPLSGALSRITKKPFGMLINPKTSPVQPERFAGYHNAVDLEITPEEQSIDVLVKALCDGKILVAKTASGYGGVMVQSCNLDGQAVTVIYGHIRLSSVTAKVGGQLNAGDVFAQLGKGFSGQTDGERKHLHLGIHKGNDVNILGYVQTKSQLSTWIDPAKYLN
jgi:hypothetical protein